MSIPVPNALARKIFLERQGLSRSPTKALGREGLSDLVHDLGFVQVDSIQWVERAHHQILFSRNQTYRPKDLQHLLERIGHGVKRLIDYRTFGILLVDDDPADADIVAQIHELLETRIRPAVANDGGDILYRGFDRGIVYLQMQGACSGCPSSTLA